MAEGAADAGRAGAVHPLPTPARAGYDRVPPHNLDAETSVLGAMLLSRDAIAEVSELIGPDDFYRGAHRTLFEAVRELYDRGEPVDPVTLADDLEHRGTLDDVGGAVGIADLVSRVPTAANALYYARIVAEQALRRRLIDAGTGITRLGYDAAKGADEAVDAAEQTIYDVAQRGYSSEFVPMKDLLMESFERIEKLHEAKSSITGLATGFTDLDELTAGLQPQNLVVIAARPAMGKCQSASTLVLDPTTGAYRRLGDIVTAAQAGAEGHVVSLGADSRLGPARVDDCHDNGVRPVFRLTTRLGREVIATGNHPLLTPDGWVPLSELGSGRRIATARSLPYFGREALPDAEVARLAGSSATSVPETVFRLRRELVALFLNRVFARDGSVSGGEPAQVTYTTTSKRLAGDVQHLLLRFGVLATRRALRRPGPDGTGEQVWELQITGSESIRTFAAEIGMVGKDDRLREVVALLGAHTNHRAHVGNRSASRALVGAVVGVRPGGVRPGGVRSEVATSDVYWDEIVAVEPAGHERVYDLTVPGDHNFVANDVVVHNSTLVTNIATHVTVELRKPAVLFSLEMSQRELIDRVLAAHSGVPSDRLRTGRLADTDWPKLSQAMGRLAEAPLFIDDTPGINMMEIRAKCRRLKAKHGLDLVIVDYLQLMQSHRRAENRVQEVSELSRGLKILAKELDLPVIALSQLSRKPEDRTDRRPQLSDLRESGCVTGDTVVALASGATVPIAALVGTQPEVVTLDGRHLSVRRASKVWRTGRKRVYRLTTGGGRVISASGNHPLRVLDGWRALEDLAVGDRVAVTDAPGGHAPITGRTDQARLAEIVGGFGARAAVVAEKTRGVELEEIAGADVAWDTVRDIEPGAVEDVYDMTVPGTHSFVGNGICLHNSIEQDSDLVAFIYRDEVYHPDTDAKGEAELILAKHRNGPLHTVRLSFLGHQSRFANMARRAGPL